MTANQVRIGTRASQLAQWQANWVAGELRALGAEVKTVEITTSGDVQQSGPITGIGLQGVFTKEIQTAVLDQRVDIAVHSLKDLPTETAEGPTACRRASARNFGRRVDFQLGFLAC